MSSYRQHLYHIVTRTKNNLPTIKQEYSDKLFAYITSIIKNKKSFLYRINGVQDHIHILTDIHPSIAPADFVKDIKVYSSLWIKKSGLHPRFEGWTEGYASLTCSFGDLERLISYVKNQQNHHQKESFEDEYRRLLKEAGIEIDERYFP
jgi:REP element-mobilizing transposase RayT